MTRPLGYSVERGEDGTIRLFVPVRVGEVHPLTHEQARALRDALTKALGEDTTPSPMGMSNLTPEEQAAENVAMEPCTVCGWGRKRHDVHGFIGHGGVMLGGAGAPHPFTPKSPPGPYEDDVDAWDEF